MSEPSPNCHRIKSRGNRLGGTEMSEGMKMGVHPGDLAACLVNLVTTSGRIGSAPTGDRENTKPSADTLSSRFRARLSTAAR